MYLLVTDYSVEQMYTCTCRQHYLLEYGRATDHYHVSGGLREHENNTYMCIYS